MNVIERCIMGPCLGVRGWFGAAGCWGGATERSTEGNKKEDGSRDFNFTGDRITLKNGLKSS